MGATRWGLAFIALLFPLLFVTLDAPAKSFHRKHPGAPAPAESFHTVWLADGEALLQLNGGTGAVMRSVPYLGKAAALAVDRARGSVWVYKKGVLAHVDSEGVVTAVTRFPPLPPPAPDPDDDDPPIEGDGDDDKKADRDSPRPDKIASLEVDQSTGELYAGYRHAVFRFARNGSLLNSWHSGGEKVKSLAFDSRNHRLWVATKRTLTAYNAEGGQVTSFPLEERERLRAIALDPKTNHLWVALRDGLIRVGADDAVDLTLEIKNARRLAADGEGGVWAVSEAVLMRVNADGSTQIAQDSKKKREEWRFIASDAADGRVFAAKSNRLVAYGPDGLRGWETKVHGAIHSLVVQSDIDPPEAAVTWPGAGSYINTPGAPILLTITDAGSGADLSTVSAALNGAAFPVTCSWGEGDAVSCAAAGALPEGQQSLSLTVKDFAGNVSEPASSVFTVDTIAPVVTLLTPGPGELVNTPQVTVSGTVSEPVSLRINVTGEGVLWDETTMLSGPPFSRTASVGEGINEIAVTATDLAGNTGSAQVTVTRDTTPPGALDAEKISVSAPEGGLVAVTGSAGSAEPGAWIEITNLRTGQTVRVRVNGDGSFSAQIAAEAGDQLSIRPVDPAGNAGEATETQTPAGGPVLKPSAIDPTVSTELYDSVRFLFEGADALQTGLDPAVLLAQRIAVLRGLVMDRDGRPLANVTVTVVGHPEFGRTVTRADGMFDMAVNGGGWLTVEYRLEGYLPVQRKVDAPWRDFAWAQDAVMTPLDPVVTTVDLAAPGMKAAQGSVVTDGDGTRQATVLFPEGTAATMTLPNGTTQALTTLHVRATEYTVGERGLEAMPAELPPTSGYTYAVELSVDEALAGGVKINGKDVIFNQPVTSFVDNFLGFPTGETIPVGYYDGDKGAWIPSENGRVVEIVAISGGMADLDVDGDGAAESAATLALMGISGAERAKLASLYAPGKSLWRVTMTHLSTWDFNQGTGPEDDNICDSCVGPKVNGPQSGPCHECGSIIEAQNQILGETLPITGAPLSLNYRSDRTPGYKAGGTVEFQITDNAPSPVLKRTVSQILVGGRKITSTHPATQNVHHNYGWDGKDAYGRVIQGPTQMTIRTGYVYNAVYTKTTKFGYSGNGVPITNNPARTELTLWRDHVVTVGGYDARAQKLGGWTIGAHHFYDPSGAKLYLGNGERRDAKDIGKVMTTLAGDGNAAFGGDGGAASGASLRDPLDVAVAPNGDVYIADAANHRIRRVGADGIITTVAGTGAAGFSGDGGLATQARINSPRGIAIGPGGVLYLTDYYNQRIRRVDPSGVISTVAGNGTAGFSGDGGPAISAKIQYPFRVAVAPDGRVYFSDRGNHRVRMIDVDGTITTVAGTGGAGFGGDGGMAAQAPLYNPSGVALDAAGALYIVDRGNFRIRKVTPGGVISTVAGNGSIGFGGDGGPATLASFADPVGVAAGPDGGLYVAANADWRIRHIDARGIITTMAGDGTYGFGGDGGPARAAQMKAPVAVAFDPEGAVYVADQTNHRIRKLVPAFSRFGLDSIIVASDDGTEYFRFDGAGRHLETLNALTGGAVFSFAYGANGYLTSVTDANGAATIIERDGSGNATAIVSPDGLRTSIAMDSNGYLASVMDPAGHANSFTYSPDGLMTSQSHPNGGRAEYAWDAEGLLIQDRDAGGGGWALARVNQPDGHTVTMTTAGGKSRVYRTVNLPGDDRRTEITGPSGGVSVSEKTLDGATNSTSPDGTVTQVTQSPDPRFGMQAPVASSVKVTTPGGLINTTSTSRDAALADPADPLSLTSLTEQVTVNGRAYSSTFVKSSLTRATASPMGRVTTTTMDASGKPVAISMAGLLPVNYSYDARGRLTMTSQGTRASSFAYDAAGFLNSVTDPLGRVTSFNYDAAGRVLNQTMPDGRSVNYTYDANGNVTSITPPGRSAHVFSYTPVDLEQSYDPPDVGLALDVTRYEYNLDKDLTRIIRPDGATVDYAYDAGGRLAGVTAPDSLIAYTYGSAGCSSCGGGDLPVSVTRTDSQGSQNIAYTYDGSLTKSVTWSGPVSGNLALTYDNDFRVTSWSVNGGPAIAQSYNADSQLTQAGGLALTYNASSGFLTGGTLGVTGDAYQYTDYGETGVYRATSGGSPVYEVSYTRDALGRIESENRVMDGVSTLWAYRYDDAGRLVEVVKDGSSWSVYRYDSNGNRVEAATQAGLVAGVYDAQDRLVSYGQYAYTYTANGELNTKTDTVTGQVTRYAYDVFGNLIRVDLPDGRVIEYVIDGANRRVGKKINGVLVKGWLYKDSLKPLAELDSSGAVVATFVYGSKYNVPDYVVKGGVAYRIFSDHLGSPRLVVNSSTGAIVSKLEYDEFGNVLGDTNPGFVPFGFAGGLYDADTGLVRFGARDYDPFAGRWTSKDPIRFDGDGNNIYSYVQSNPIQHIDPKGMASVTNRSNRTISVGGNPGFGQGSGDQVALSLDPGETINRYNPKNGVGDVDQIEGKKIIGNDFAPHVNVYDDGNGGLDIAIWPFGPYYTPFNIPSPRIPLGWLSDFDEGLIPTIFSNQNPCW